MTEAWLEQQALSYRNFRISESQNKIMDKRNLAIILDCPPKYRDVLLSDLTETLHLPPIVPDIISQNTQLLPHGYIFSGYPKEKVDVDRVQKWSKESKINLHVVKVIDCSKFESSGDLLKDADCIKHEIEMNEGVDEVSKNIFRKLSPYCFEDPNLADDYYKFRDTCEKLNTDHILISGACSYIYWGRRPLKDIDVLVPNLEQLKNLGFTVNQPVDHLVSSFADTQYLNFASSLEPVCDLAVFSDIDENKVRINFDWSDINEDSKEVRFLGVKCKLMSPEMLVLFKFCLGRFGIDKWGKHKDDYEDARGVIISQSIDWNKVEQLAIKLGALDQVKKGKKILDL